MTEEGTAARSTAAHHTLPPLLRSFELWTILLFVLSMLFHFVESLRGVSAYMGSPLSNAANRFYDFRIFAYKFEFFHTPDFYRVGFPINYPAPCALFLEFFFHWFHHPVRAFIAFCVLVFAACAVFVARALHRRGVARSEATFFVLSTGLLSWPIVLLIDRGNVEILVFLSLLIALWAYSTGRLWLAAGFFGAAASVKLFPFVLLGLFASRKQWDKVLFGAASFLFISLLSLAILGPSIPAAYRGLGAGLGSFKINYMGAWRWDEGGVDHSLFNLYKWLGVTFFHHSWDYTHDLAFYLPGTAIFGVLLYLFRIRLLPLLNQVLLLTISSIFLTAFSGDGTLVHLYAPLVMLLFVAVAAYRRGIAVPGLRLMLNCLVYILSFETFLVHRHQRFIGVTK